MASSQHLSPATFAVVGGRPGRTPGSPVSPGIELTSTYVQPGDIDPDLPLYGRYANATWAALEEVIGGLEGSPEGAVAFASGMAAGAALFSLTLYLAGFIAALALLLSIASRRATASSLKGV